MSSKAPNVLSLKDVIDLDVFSFSSRYFGIRRSHEMLSAGDESLEADPEKQTREDVQKSLLLIHLFGSVIQSYQLGMWCEGVRV